MFLAFLEVLAPTVTAEGSRWGERFVVYGPFFLSLLALIPKGEWILARKLEDLIDKAETREEVKTTFSLVEKFERLVEVSIFDILYAYINLLSGLIEASPCIEKNRIVLGVATLFAYHALLAFLGWRIYLDSQRMNYSSMIETYWRGFGLRLSGRRYLSALLVVLVIVSMLFTAISRFALTGSV